MSDAQTFDLTAQHLTLLQHMIVGWNGDEYGAPTIDPKRPYSHGDVEESICEILALPKVADPRVRDAWVYAWEAKEHAARLHRQMVNALQIVLCTQSFRPGVYQLTEPYEVRSWVFVHD